MLRKSWENERKEGAIEEVREEREEYGDKRWGAKKGRKEKMEEKWEGEKERGRKK